MHIARWALIFLLILWAPAASSAEVIGGVMGENLTHPGVKIGLEWPLLGPDHPRWRVTGGASVWAHPRNHLGVLLMPQIGPRWVAKSGGLFELLVGVGYLHMRPLGALYTRDTSGDIVRQAHLGYPSLGIQLTAGFGWDLSRSVSVPLAVHLRPFVLGQYPSSTFLIPRWGLCVEVRRVRPP